MIYLTLAKTKGGTSATTTSLGTSFCLAKRGYKVTLIDLDLKSAKATEWKKNRLKRGEKNLPENFELFDAPTMKDLIIYQQVDPYDFMFNLSQDKEYATEDRVVIIDTAGGADEYILDALRLADMVISPQGVSYADTSGVVDTRLIVKKIERDRNKKIPFRGLINRMPHFVVSNEKREQIEDTLSDYMEHDITPMENFYCERVGYSRMLRKGETQYELPAKGQDNTALIIAETENVTDEILRVLSESYA